MGIASMAAIGPNIWVGLADGRVRVYKDSGQQDFQAHDAGIIAIVPCGVRAFTLAADGSLKGWSALSPSPVDAAARYSLVTEQKRGSILMIGSCNSISHSAYLTAG